MKYLKAAAVSSIAIWLVGCASTSKVVLQDSVGPCHRMSAPSASDGFLQVYSARERAPIDLNLQENFWNNDFGKNEFLYGSALSAYTVFNEDGTVARQVRRNRGSNDGTPATISLPAGHYSVEAEAEEQGGITVTVVVPLVVESGQITSIRLDPAWNRPREIPSPGHVLALADGRIVGCRAEHMVGQQTQPAALVAHSANTLPTP